jgi:hypothetical protein
MERGSVRGPFYRFVSGSVPARDVREVDFEWQLTIK